MEIKDPHTILLTFDYELFLHRSGSVERCMLEPTNAILEILRQRNIKATFFVDILSLGEIRKVSRAQYSSIQSQLLQMLDHGHRVELHLHPQWQDAEYD